MRDPLGQLRLRFAGLQLVRDGEIAQVYAGRDFSGYDVTVAVLSERVAGAEAMRRTFAEAVRRQAGSAGVSTVHSDIRAERPWVAARQPDGAAVVDRVIAELAGGGTPAVAEPGPGLADPTGLGTFAPFPPEPPTPVWPDPTLAPTPPVPSPPPPRPSTPTPSTPTPSPSRPARPSAPPSARPARSPTPPQRPTRPGQSPAPPQRPTRPAPARSASQSLRQQLSPVGIVVLVVIGSLVLSACCASGVVSAL